MMRTMLAMTTALTLMTGVAVAQTTTTTMTESSTAVPVPVVPVAPPTVVESTTHRTIEPNGVVTDQSRSVTSGSVMSPLGDTTTTRKSTETTTVR